MPHARPFILSAMAGTAGLTAAASGQSPPDYNFDWVTIGAPGNRAATEDEAPYLFPPYETPAIIVGAVDHAYRLTLTEVTTAQWFEFLNVYWPHSAFPRTDDVRLTGLYINAADTTQGHNPQYYIVDGGENKAMETSWQMAARFVNWLHNGKSSQAWAFETGVYDTSTFTQNADHTWNDQLTHSPGAQFWIPTLDEWIKGMYYDPSGNGPGQDRYWMYPITSDTPPIPGWPWDGGQTAAGLTTSSGPYLDVGSYPWVTSPWGLLDGTGCENQWTEYMTSDRLTRILKGTHEFEPNPEYFDRVDVLGATDPNFTIHGFRAASLPSCYANCDGSTSPPALNVQDFSCFMQRFVAGDQYANCDGSTIAPVLNVQDFTCFLQRFARGCN